MDEPPKPRRILIIKPSSLGDIAHALPVLAALRAAYPDAFIAWLAGTSFVPLLTGHPLLDEVIPFDRKRYGTMWWNPLANFAFWRFVASIRRRRFDLVVDLQGLIRSGLLSLFSGARRRVGFAAAREGAWLFYTQRVRCPREVEHAVDRNLQIAAALGLETRAEFPLAVTDKETASARAMLDDAAGGECGPFTAVLPGARWESKLWPLERFAELIDRLQSDGRTRCVLFGAPDERERAKRIREKCASPPLDLTGHTTLRELAAALDLSERVICCDSGPMHIAAALGKPMVAIFGPTNPARTGPYCDSARVLTQPIECAPCYQRKCPLGHHGCMERLGVERVLAMAALDEVRAER